LTFHEFSDWNVNFAIGVTIASGVILITTDQEMADITKVPSARKKMTKKTANHQ